MTRIGAVDEHQEAGPPRRLGIDRDRLLIDQHDDSCNGESEGGAGKTTLTLNLAAGFVELGRRVQVIDADPQGSATRWAMRRDGEHLAPIHQLPVEDEQAAGRFSTALRRLAKKTAADCVFIDCPPGLPTAAIAALLLADLVLIPVTPSPLDLWAAEKALELVSDARQARGKENLPRVILVPSRLIAGTVMARELPATLDEFGELVAPGITQRVALVESAIVGQVINEYAPGSKAHLEFQELTRFTIRVLEGRV